MGRAVLSHSCALTTSIDETRRSETVSAAHLGVDPGINGALAFFDPLQGTLELVDMPTVQVTRNGKTKRRVCGRSLARIIGSRLAIRDYHVTVEQVGAMPGQGVTSMFTFGRGVGTIDGVLGASDIIPKEVPPRVWQAGVGLPPKAGKGASRARAAALFPAYASQFARVKDDGRADAALIAFYAAATRS